MVEDVTSVIEVAAPREQVWRALTEPSLVAQWMGALRFQPLVGHVFWLQPDRTRRIAGDPTDGIACRLEILDPPRRVAFSWGLPDTHVDIRLRNISGGTHVRLVHSGWDQFDEREVDGIAGGMGHAWHAVALPALRRVAESG